jgi:hypothetical protein
MSQDFLSIWVGVVSLWVVISIARRISREQRDTPTIIDHSD